MSPSVVTPTAGSAVPERGARKRLDPRFWLPVLLLTTGQVLARTWAAAGGWFYWDDFWWHDIVARTGLFEASGLSLGGHFSPLTYVPYWLVTHWFPLEWGPRVVVMVGTLLLINAAVLLVVTQLWHTNGPRLAVYCLWCTSALVAPAWLWYSQFSMTGALLLTSTLCLWAYLRALRTRTTSSAMTAVVLLLVALLTQERMLALAIPMGMLLFLVIGETPGRVWQHGRGMWWSSLGVLFGYAILYWTVAEEPPGTRVPSLAEGLGLGWRVVTTSAVPAFLGAAWPLDHTPVLARADTAAVLRAAAILAVIVAVVVSQRLNRRAWRAWVTLAVAVLLDAALVVAGRGATLGADAVGEWRYFSDLAVLGPVCVVAAFVQPGSTPNLGRRTGRALTAVVVLVGVGGLAVTLALGQRWHQSTSRPFVERALTDLTAQPDAVIMDRPVPETVVNRPLGVQRLASRVFSIVRPAVKFDLATPTPRWIDDRGALVHGDIGPTRVSGRPGACAFPLAGTTTVEIPLPGTWDYDWGVRLDYDVPQPVRLVVRAATQSSVVDLPQGRGVVYVPIRAVFRDISVYATSADARGCVSQVVAGPAQAAVSQN